MAAASREVSPAELEAVYNAYQRSAAQDFTPESLVTVYKLPNAAAAVKKLVDLHGTGNGMSISPQHSLRMESTRQHMNLTILRKLAKITGGTVEVLNFGKMNGIRSDKDQTLYSVDGKRFYSGDEICEKYGHLFKKTYGIDMALMDMERFDADARVPDWRDAKMTYSQFQQAYQQGEAKLMQNEPAYKGGAYRAQVDRRSASAGRVTVIKYMGKDDNGNDRFEELIDVPAAEASSQYKHWSADVPYRNAMDACHQNLQRFRGSADFIDKMKYFNRTIGDGINALALENWDVDYIFHLKELAQQGNQGQIDAFLRTMVNDVFVVDLSDADRQHFFQVIRIAAQIEVDKMLGRTQSESAYLKPLLADVGKTSKGLSAEQQLEEARRRFFGFQERIMKHNLAATARQKIQRDLSPKRLKMVAAKYGAEQAKKLQWETGHQIKRIFAEINDDRLVSRIISDAPESLQKPLQDLHQLNRVRRTRGKAPSVRLADSDPQKARQHGPGEIEVLVQRKKTALEDREQDTTLFLGLLKKRYADFDADLRAGRYSDAQISRDVRERVLSELGFEDRAVLRNMEVEFERRFSGRKLLGNALSLGNADSAINMIRVYQRTGDWNQVAQTAVWELVSNIPGVSQAAVLKQAFNDGNYEGLAWMYIAWNLPAAGQVKLVFDVAKGTVEIVYHHMMDPLEDDRLSQVYRGYIAAQPAGWSPFQPGWKTRQNAVADSILHFVPGKTFPEKRTQMYAYFQAKLDQRLRRNGLDPTETAYWVQRDTVIAPFFRRYVTDYFEARGEWSNNVVAGLRGMGTQEQLKARLVAQLAADFRAGEVLWEQSVEARWQLEKALEQHQMLRLKMIATEKRLAGAEDFLLDRIGGAYQQAVAKVEKDPAKTIAVQAEAYPPVVAEGQAVTIDVKVLSPAAENSQPKVHPVDIRVARVTPLAKGRKIDIDSLDSVVGDSDYIRDFADALQASDQTLNAVRIDYDVAVKADDGGLLDKRRVSVVLAGGEEKVAIPEADGCPVPPDAVYIERVLYDGHLIREYENSEGKGVGPYSEFYDKEGRQIYKRGCLALKEGSRTGVHHGLYEEWFPNGQKKKSCYLFDSDPDGFVDQIRYYGVYRRWSESGTLLVEANYKDGLAHGTTTHWDEHTKKKVSETQFKNGKKNGLYRTWYQGILSSEITYKDDKQHGTSKRWDRKGRLEYVYSYKNGKKHGQKIHYASNGWQTVETYQDDVLHGRCEKRKNGVLEREEEYRNGKKVWEKWYQNGKLIHHWTY
ncbi:toxin-antitoxin system YwqK family antitoxin [uncultured Desulfosarcina sp.]|uniref:toxin-antitoxin system YwqK family antitoxin n=1 Tax=uncultured Desulfosarcina sp. TaxID=218289 RepID=UPI0029C98BF4|nr:toxin-antitoxin system YwqK family antitoxin [uncultured Desulfosarcina sp.]